jgi:hypothetical protein
MTRGGAVDPDAARVIVPVKAPAPIPVMSTETSRVKGVVVPLGLMSSQFCPSLVVTGALANVNGLPVALLMVRL